ncbi:MAG TPA: cupredoxin domain-containing protein [Candidatus Dormibacteraeota bacterium]|nr:cupredoxin domain-containing protein [Candidatus Dormibacteraeota bacterium]
MLIQTGRVGWTAFSLLVLLTTGCGQQQASSPGAGTTTSSSANGGSPASVSVKNLAFTPAAVTIPAGGKVVWRFEDGEAPHTVTADANSFGSAPNGLTSGTFEHGFGKAGTYDYHCDFHPTMKGTVTVR